MITTRLRSVFCFDVFQDFVIIFSLACFKFVRPYPQIWPVHKLEALEASPKTQGKIIINNRLKNAKTKNNLR